MITELQSEEQLGLQQFRQPGQRELVHPDAGPLAGDPVCEPLASQRGDGVPAQKPLVMETAQPAAGDALAAAAGHPASGSPLQRPGPGDERPDGFAAVLAPAALVPEAQPRAVQIAFTAEHCAKIRAQQPPHAGRRGGIELIPADPSRDTGTPASIAASRRTSCPRRAPRCPAQPRRGPRRRQVPGEQQRPAVPLARTPRRIQPVMQPLQPVLTGRTRAAGGHGCEQRRPAHRYCFPAATASTARRLSSSRACR
jgi:hypothetical protein